MKLNAKTPRWQMTALAAAAMAIFGLVVPSAHALSLGRVTVQSALGEPLRAEIEVPDINADEAATLKTSVALPEAFRAAGLEYNPAMSGLQFSLQRRPDGRAYIRLTSDRAINDPFVDMIIEASWSSGRIVRDYTMLLDPPSLRAVAGAAAPTPVVPAQVTAAPAARPATVAKPVPAPASAAAAPTAATKPPAPKAAGTNEQQVKVMPGDTASKIAAANKPASVSLDQMLVALLRANPDAFIRENINRIKSGAVLNLPDAVIAGAVPPAEASQIVIAQSRDFNDFRKSLADNAQTTQVAAADRQASGAIQTKVEDKKAASVAPDKLTLSKGAVEAKAAEDKIAQDKQAQETANRAAELAKNIKELSKIGAAAGSAANTTASAPVTPAVPVAVNAPEAATSSASPTPSPAASVAQTPVKPAPVVPAPVAEPTLLDQLMENPMVPPAAGGLLALLAGLAFYRIRQRKNAGHVDSSLMDSKLQSESFFGTSGGQKVNTSSGAATGSSMAYSHSQLDSGDDVDPVAEADVYLAYGRDLQAEEILKEALKTTPERLAIHQKLLEIYAKRNDTKGFESVATAAHGLTSGDGIEWNRVCEMGLGIDPGNPLYQPGGQPDTNEAPTPVLIDEDGAERDAGPLTEPLMTEAATPAGSVDLDLDLDFSLDDTPAPTSTAAPDTTSEPTQVIDAQPESEHGELDVDFSLPEQAPEAQAEAMPSARAALEEQADEPPEPSLDLELPPKNFSLTGMESEEFRQEAAVSFGSTAPAPLSMSTPAADEDAPQAKPAESGMIEFDLGSLSLDLGPSAETAAEPEAEPAGSDDPLATKLALAEEFVAIGDDDGARALIEEVIAEATGDMKVMAQRALSSLS